MANSALLSARYVCVCVRVRVCKEHVRGESLFKGNGTAPCFWSGVRVCVFVLVCAKNRYAQRMCAKVMVHSTLLSARYECVCVCD